MASKKPTPKPTAKTRAKSAATPKPSAKASPKPKAPKLGRPPRAGKAATTGIMVRMTNAERAKIQAAAERAGKSIAGFMRDVALLQSEKT